MSLTVSVLDIVNRSTSGLLGKHESWERVELDFIAKVLNGFAFSSANFSKERGMPLIRIRDISNDFTEVKYDGPYDELYLVELEDLLVGMDGDFNCALWKGSRGLLNQRVCKIEVYQELFNKKFLFYVLPSYLKAINDATSSMTVKHLSSSTVEEIPLPLPPLPEQTRIVAAIEQQFSRLDSAVASLQSAKDRTKQYRASLLKSAVEGELTKEWRAEHPAQETGAQLLARILTERRKRWEEEQLAKMREKGITPKDDKWKQAYKEPQRPDVKGLPELSEGWCYTFLQPLLSVSRKGIVTGPFGSLLKKHEHQATGIPVLGIENIAAMKFVAGSKIHITQDKAIELSQYDALPGDILISRSGTVGEVCVVPESLGEARISTNLMRVSLAEYGMLPQFFCLLFNGSPFVLDQVSELCKGSTRDFLSQTILSQIIFPLPPLAEQAQIVAEVEEQLSNIEQMEATIERCLKRAEHERQSILREAFAGRLVAQDPHDEPASVLLERIREERKRREAEEKVVKRSRKGVAMGITRKRHTKAGQSEIGLYQTLVEAGQPLAPDDLFRRVGLKADEQPESVETFYHELHADENVLIRETRPDGRVLLEVMEPPPEMLAAVEEKEAREQSPQNGGQGKTLWDV